MRNYEIIAELQLETAISCISCNSSNSNLNPSSSFLELVLSFSRLSTDKLSWASLLAANARCQQRRQRKLQVCVTEKPAQAQMMPARCDSIAEGCWFAQVQRRDCANTSPDRAETSPTSPARLPKRSWLGCKSCSENRKFLNVPYSLYNTRKSLWFSLYSLELLSKMESTLMKTTLYTYNQGNIHFSHKYYILIEKSYSVNWVKMTLFVLRYK